ncbi:hypothetical protein ACM61V_11830 [Sphingomonas sp. TX0543]|uniref:hypothetical protein n=1 Tax=unclassified Sphingomonas TaxID=196159 RepID=UPI0010F516C1|nr:hypothetical protein [Sphingomonas sp. 3P27F8]
MTTHNYSRYVDDVLLAVADKQIGPNLLPVNVDELHHELFSDRPTEWVQAIIGDLEGRGYGKDRDIQNSRVFLINGKGLARVAEIREERRPRNILDYLRGFSRSDWIALAAFVVSVIALIKGK